ncbi:MAG: hypothetical protein WA843_01390 [Candidatus Saccharimonadales bacterium]
MSYKDTLTLYDELIAKGTSEAQARAQAEQLGQLGTYVGNMVNDVKMELIEIKKDLRWMYILGAAMTVAFFSNILFR